MFSFHSSPYEMRKFFNREGFLIIDTGIDDAELLQITDDLSAYFGPDRVVPDGVTLANERRIQDAWHISASVRNLALNAQILALLKTLYDVPFKPFQTLNFVKGTQQPIHADSIHFNSEPFGLMCGVWVALEDVGLDQGPLVYYPGTQKLPEMNYSYFGLPSSEKSQLAYSNALQELIIEKGFASELASVKRGQAVIWAANIAHGGAKQTDLRLSRHSQVTLYYAQGIRYWRPSMSDLQRHYFTPNWVISRRREKINSALRYAPNKLQQLKAFLNKRLGRAK